MILRCCAVWNCLDPADGTIYYTKARTTIDYCTTHLKKREVSLVQAGVDFEVKYFNQEDENTTNPSNPSNPSCTCPWDLVYAKGCQCGAMKKELEEKYG